MKESLCLTVATYGNLIMSIHWWTDTIRLQIWVNDWSLEL